MELELKKETLCFYEFSTAATAVHEEATETIVPDYCPDIARIIDSDGKVFLRGKDIQGDKAIVTGSVKVTVLFTPEVRMGFAILNFRSHSIHPFPIRILSTVKVFLPGYTSRALRPKA